MASILLRLTTYDPRVIAALEDLRRSRKQSLFVLEALRHYLESDAGQDALAAMTGNYARERCKQKPQSVQKEKPAAGKTISVGDIFR